MLHCRQVASDLRTTAGFVPRIKPISPKMKQPPQPWVPKMPIDYCKPLLRVNLGGMF